MNRDRPRRGSRRSAPTRRPRWRRRRPARRHPRRYQRASVRSPRLPMPNPSNPQTPGPSSPSRRARPTTPYRRHRSALRLPSAALSAAGRRWSWPTASPRQAGCGAGWTASWPTTTGGGRRHAGPRRVAAVAASLPREPLCSANRRAVRLSGLLDGGALLPPPRPVPTRPCQCVGADIGDGRNRRSRRTAERRPPMRLWPTSSTRR